MDLALFDFDGTITSRETFPPFLRAVTPPTRWAIGVPLFAPLVLGYRAGLVSGNLTRAALVRYALAGLPVAELEAAGRRFAAEAIPQLLRPEAMARIAWHRKRGDAIAVVSGAFDVYLRPWCDAHGLDLLCSTLEQRDGVLTGRYAGAQCVREEKVRRVRAQYDLWRFERIHAYGDTPEDRELLALADAPHYRGQRVPDGLPLEVAIRAAR
ncbi:MAG TPA: HAD family hydrolase [Lysobacter sp.]|nr:HAD family hydrolase [Lysobacter sp.]